MPHVVADPSSPSCSHLFSGTEIQESQRLDPDPLRSRARDARGRFAKGCSGNPRGRPPGTPNPRRRVPDLIARPLTAKALSDLIDRKPDLLRPLAKQVLPPPAAPCHFLPRKRAGVCTDIPDPKYPLLRPWGGEGRGEVGEPQAPSSGTTHLAPPTPFGAGPSLSPRKRAERGKGAGNRPRPECVHTLAQAGEPPDGRPPGRAFRG